MNIQKEKTENSQKVGRPKKEAAEGRVKYSTVLQPSLIKFLKKYAADTERTPADILEIAVSTLQAEKERNQ